MSLLYGLFPNTLTYIVGHGLDLYQEKISPSMDVCTHYTRRYRLNTDIIVMVVIIISQLITLITLM